MIDVYREVSAAEKRIRPYIRETPLEPSLFLSKAAACHASLKLENLQITGSFKLRGAFNKLLSLTETERQRGIITASTGNHGLATAHALKTLGIKGTIYLPENAAPQKVKLLQQFGADLHFYSTDPEATEQYARRQSEAEDKVYVSPYNDPCIIGGQGTIAVELLRQIEQVDSVLIAVGGGGLISGIAGYLKAVRPAIEIIGCLPENSPVMYESMQAQKIVEMPSLPTLSDGTAGGIEPGAITFDLCQRFVDDWVLVDEQEIQAAMKLLFEEHRLVVEGAAGVPVASLLKLKDQLYGKHVALILCGGNIAIEKFKTLVW